MRFTGEDRAERRTEGSALVRYSCLREGSGGIVAGSGKVSRVSSGVSADSRRLSRGIRSNPRRDGSKVLGRWVTEGGDGAGSVGGGADAVTVVADSRFCNS